MIPSRVDGCSVWVEPSIQRAHSWQFSEPGERPQGAQIGSSLGGSSWSPIFRRRLLACTENRFGHQRSAGGRINKGGVKETRGGVKETRGGVKSIGGGQRNKGGGQINRGGSKKQGGGQINKGGGSNK